MSDWGDITVAELHRRAPIYSREWLRQAINAGCATWADLERRWAERSAHHQRVVKAKKIKPWIRHRAY